MSEIHNFINHFHKVSKTQNIDEVFTCGCCYWFAYILRERFPEARMMYDPIINHFMVMINERLYDITGDVTEKYKPIPWDEFSDDLERGRIVKYCIDFS